LSYEILEEPGVTILGIFVRASNENPERIGDLWRRFHAMGDAKCVEGRLEDAAYCVYCEYEGDFTKPYTVVVGCAVSTGAAVPDGMKKVDVVAGRFAVIQVKGELPQGVFDAWGEVWAAPLDKRYQADFDRYRVGGDVTVHVGVK
jgi:predicted transcriptional regulator YdeE